MHSHLGAAEHNCADPLDWFVNLDFDLVKKKEDTSKSWKLLSATTRPNSSTSVKFIEYINIFVFKVSWVWQLSNIGFAQKVKQL